MSQKKKGSRKSSKKEIEFEEVLPSLTSSMSPETLRGIVGVLLFITAILLVLSSLGLAGIAGNTVFKGIYYVVGIGYWLLPIMLTALAWSYVSSAYDKNNLRSIKT